MTVPDPFAAAGTIGAREDRGALWPAVLAGWALAALVLVAVSIPAIVALRFPDPDDAMRLLQVRDWLAGQSWWDVAQHRLNGGDFPMHWSRLVDLPIAAIYAPVQALFGDAVATRAAMIVVPLVTLLAIMALAAAVTRRVSDLATARLAVLIVPLSTPIVYQARPLRIDHHGWQIALALGAMLLLLGRPTARRGAGVGAALAVLLTISLEGLPIAAAIGGVAAIAWALDPARRRGFTLALGWTLALAAAALHVATRGPGAWQPACDAMAPAWLGALAIAALGLTGAVAVARFGWAARFAMLAATGAGAIAFLHAAAPLCLAGPFATLPPLVYRLWYVEVLEGRPLWEQEPLWAITTIGLPIAGLIGGARAWRAAHGRARARWAMLLGLLAAATIVAVFVNRAGATANALAVPGAAALLLALLTRARTIAAPGRRTLATAGALLAAAPGQAGGAALALVQVVDPPAARMARENDWHRPPCDQFADLRVVGALPAGTVFAPIDVSPDIIATTHQRAVAGGYHRGAAAMDRVMRAFTGTPEAARTIVLASGADYLAACPGFNEMDLYRFVAPDGLWARLERGERIAWLAPVPLAGPALVWRVIRPSPIQRLPERRQHH